jgi:hypothetical protein
MSESAPTARYLAAFGELTRVTSSDLAVPESLWAELRQAWEAMSLEEQAALEARLSAEAKEQARRGGR